MSTKPRHQMSATRRHQPGAYKKTVNGNGNRESTVTVGKRGVNKHPVARLSNLQQPAAKTQYLAEEIAGELGDKHSLRFHYLVAAKVPESVIRRTLSDLKVNGADNPRRVFNYRMRRYAEDQLSAQHSKQVVVGKKELARRLAAR